MNELNAVSLKSELWNTLQAIKGGTMTPQQGDAIACQAREILRASRIQLAIFSQSNRPVTVEMIGFADPKA